MYLTNYQLTFLVPETHWQELLTKFTKGFISARHILFSPDDTQILISQVEIQIFPVVRHTEILLHILMFHLTRNEIQRSALYESIHDRCIYNTVTPSYLLVINFTYHQILGYLLLFFCHIKLIIIQLL